MSDPASNVNIEDVLTSIRRLVSTRPDQEASAPPAANPEGAPVQEATPVAEPVVEVQQSHDSPAAEAEEAGRLVLTPSLRVSQDPSGLQRPPGAADLTENSDVQAPPSAQIAEDGFGAVSTPPGPVTADPVLFLRRGGEERTGEETLVLRDRAAPTEDIPPEPAQSENAAKAAQLESALLAKSDEWEPDGSEVASDQAWHEVADVPFVHARGAAATAEARADRERRHAELEAEAEHHAQPEAFENGEGSTSADEGTTAHQFVFESERTEEPTPTTAEHGEATSAYVLTGALDEVVAEPEVEVEASEEATPADDTDIGYSDEDVDLPAAGGDEVAAPVQENDEDAAISGEQWDASELGESPEAGELSIEPVGQEEMVETVQAPDEVADIVDDAAAAEVSPGHTAENDPWDVAAEGQPETEPEPVAEFDADPWASFTEPANDAAEPASDAQETPEAAPEADGTQGDASEGLPTDGETVEPLTDDVAEQTEPTVSDALDAMDTKADASPLEEPTPAIVDAPEQTVADAEIEAEDAETKRFEEALVDEAPAQTAVTSDPGYELTEDDMGAALPATLPIGEAELRELVSDIVREELRGALGERITGNVRKLVRREIHRVLASLEMDG